MNDEHNYDNNYSTNQLENGEEGSDTEDHFCPKEDAENYKGIFFNGNGDDSERKTFEGGAHFSYHDLCSKLEKIAKNSNFNDDSECGEPTISNSNSNSKSNKDSTKEKSAKVHSGENFFSNNSSGKRKVNESLFNKKNSVGVGVVNANLINFINSSSQRSNANNAQGQGHSQGLGLGQIQENSQSQAQALGYKVQQNSGGTNVTVKVKISNNGNGTQNINIIKPSFEVNLNQGNNNEKNNFNFFNNMLCSHSRNLDNIYNNPSDIVNKLNTMNIKQGRTDEDISKKKFKSSSLQKKEPVTAVGAATTLGTNVVKAGEIKGFEHLLNKSSIKKVSKLKDTSLEIKDSKKIDPSPNNKKNSSNKNLLECFLNSGGYQSQDQVSANQQIKSNQVNQQEHKYKVLFSSKEKNIYNNAQNSYNKKDSVYYGTSFGSNKSGAVKDIQNVLVDCNREIEVERNTKIENKDKSLGLFVKNCAKKTKSMNKSQYTSEDKLSSRGQGSRPGHIGNKSSSSSTAINLNTFNQNQAGKTQTFLGLNIGLSSINVVNQQPHQPVQATQDFHLNINKNEYHAQSRNKVSTIEIEEKDSFKNPSLIKSTNIQKKNLNHFSFDNQPSSAQEIFSSWNQNNKKSRNENRNYLVKNNSNGYNSEKLNMHHLTGSYQKNLQLTQLLVQNKKSSSMKKKILLENSIKTQIMKKNEIMQKNIQKLEQMEKSEKVSLVHGGICKVDISNTIFDNKEQLPISLTLKSCGENYNVNHSSNKVSSVNNQTSKATSASRNHQISQVTQNSSNMDKSQKNTEFLKINQLLNSKINLTNKFAQVTKQEIIGADKQNTPATATKPKKRLMSHDFKNS